MTTKVCFITGATRGIGAEIAKAPLVDGNQVAATGRKPAAVTPRFSDNLLPLAQDVTRKVKVEMAAQLPTIAVVFTVGGPVVYQRRSDQFA
jgi:NAD(P)-dependent dehydrogenase (short-subunit alcohol dehydrogenase family)